MKPIELLKEISTPSLRTYPFKRKDEADSWERLKDKDCVAIIIEDALNRYSVSALLLDIDNLKPLFIEAFKGSGNVYWTHTISRKKVDLIAKTGKVVDKEVYDKIKQIFVAEDL